MMIHPECEMETPMNTQTATDNRPRWKRLEASFSKYRIMVVDDMPLNVKLACAHLATAGYEHFIKVTDSTTVMGELYRDPPDLLLLDLMMPQVSGLEILETIRADDQFSHLPVLILTASTEREHRLKALELGATDFLNKPIDAEEMLPRVRNALFMKAYQNDLESLVEQRTREIRVAQQEVVHCLARAAEFRDNETGKHVIRVGRYVAIIARGLGMDRRAVEMLQQASTLHDVGKIGIADRVLLKPGKLTDNEFEEMKNHCVYGNEICQHHHENEVSGQSLSGIDLFRECQSPLLKLASSIAATHHEKWDGSGYPLGLKGEAIPLEGRITAVADVFDAVSSRRPYKEPFPLEKCIAILEEGRGKHFDPKLVDIFFDHMDEVVQIRDEYADE